MPTGLEPPSLPPLEGQWPNAAVAAAAAQQYPQPDAHQEQLQYSHHDHAVADQSSTTIPAETYPPALSRRQKMARGTISKVDSVYSSVHAIEVTTNLLQDTHQYLEKVSSDLAKLGVNLESLKLPCECLKVAIDGLDEHGSIISQAICNSSDTKAFKYAQVKLIKTQKKQYDSKIAGSGIMDRDPKSALGGSLKYAKDTLAEILSKTNPDFLDPDREKKKKRKKKSVEGKSEEGEDGKSAAKKQKANDPTNGIEVIDLPTPFEGHGRMYSPFETVAFINHISENTSGHVGTQYLRAYKEKMMAGKLVPVRKSQLNDLVKKYSGLGPNTPVAPLHWNGRGAREAGWDNLLSQFQEKQNRGMAWSIDDTKKVLTDAATESKKKAPKWELIEGHHSTLILYAKRKNHINEQIQVQEQRLRENPPAVPEKSTLPTSQTKKRKEIRFNKNDKKYRHIHLPPPLDGAVYTPKECVDNMYNFANQVPPPGRSDVRAFKEKMIAEKFVPVAMSQLNHLCTTHGGPDKPPAPKYWSQKGREELMSIGDLSQLVTDHPLAVWSIDDTRDAIWERKRVKSMARKPDLAPEDVKCPDMKTVHAYHTALLSLPSIVHKVVKPDNIKLKPGPKPKMKYDDEESDML